MLSPGVEADALRTENLDVVIVGCAILLAFVVTVTPFKTKSIKACDGSTTLFVPVLMIGSPTVNMTAAKDGEATIGAELITTVGANKTKSNDTKVALACVCAPEDTVGVKAIKDDVDSVVVTIALVETLVDG